VTESVQELLNSFDRLPESEQREVAYEILKRANHLDHGPLDDETIDGIADESFQLLDADEAAEGRT
jgi:hypothetical protein